MARKTGETLVRKDEAMEDFEAIAEAKWELANDVYQLQDRGTQDAIDKIQNTLKQHATGHKDFPLSSRVVGQLTFYLAVEAAKDLLFSDIRIAAFEFPEHLCASCGASA